MLHTSSCCNSTRIQASTADGAEADASTPDAYVSCGGDEDDGSKGLDAQDVLQEESLHQDDLVWHILHLLDHEVLRVHHRS